MMPKPPSNADFTPAAALSLLPFEAALFVVSNFLAEAQIAEGEQNAVRQRNCYAAAEGLRPSVRLHGTHAVSVE